MMAFLDDRLWVHPKWVALSDNAWRLGVSAICYAHGFKTNGRVTLEMRYALRASNEAVEELLTVGLWERNDGVTFLIHDWDVYNPDPRKERSRKQGRERQKTYRERQALRNANGRHDDSVTERHKSLRNVAESESESEVTPLPPLPEGDGDVECLNCGKKTAPGEPCRHCGVNQRTAGTNPRAIATRETAERKQGRKQQLLLDALEEIEHAGPTGTDLLHDRLDELERRHGTTLTDQERNRLVDEYAEKWRT